MLASPTAERALAMTLAVGRHHQLARIAVVLVIVAVAATAAAFGVIAVVRRARRGPAGRVPEPGPVPDGRAPAQKPAIWVDHLTKTYRMGSVQVRALDDIRLEIAAGAMVCIMGRSGSGKSTLLRQLGLVDRPSGGHVFLGQREVTGLPERERTELRLSRLGYVFQEYALLPELTAAENVLLPAMMLGSRRRVRKERAAELLDLVGLAGRAGHRPRELSGGEQQRVAIARALVNNPVIIFADEPTANLDTVSARTVMQTLQELNAALGVTVLFVSHDPDDARYATQIIRLSDGKIAPEQA